MLDQCPPVFRDPFALGGDLDRCALTATSSGLGVMLNNNERMGNIEQNYALLFVIALLAFAIDFLIRFFQRGLFQWRRDL